MDSGRDQYRTDPPPPKAQPVKYDEEPSKGKGLRNCLIVLMVLFLLLAIGLILAIVLYRLGDDDDDDGTEYQDALVSQLDTFTRTFNSGDFDEMATIYHLDAQLLPMGGAEQLGREVVVAGVKEAKEKFGMAKVERTFTHAERFSADTAMTYSKWAWYKSDGELGGTNRDILRWRMVEGEWLIYVDIFNTPY